MNAGVAQLVERLLAKQQAEGSSPFTRSKYSLDLSTHRCYIHIMEQLVIYFTLSNGCSYSFEQSIPVQYESAEKLLVDLDDALNTFKDTDWKERGVDIKVGNLTFNIDVFQQYDGNEVHHELPEILTLQEWFEKVKSESI